MNRLRVWMRDMSEPQAWGLLLSAAALWVALLLMGWYIAGAVLGAAFIGLVAWVDE